MPKVPGPQTSCVISLSTLVQMFWPGTTRVLSLCFARIFSVIVIGLFTCTQLLCQVTAVQEASPVKYEQSQVTTSTFSDTKLLRNLCQYVPSQSEMGSLMEWVVLQQPDCSIRAFACCSVGMSRLFFLCKQSTTVDTFKQTVHVKILTSGHV